jgi:hypothetical protein
VLKRVGVLEQEEFMFCMDLIFCFSLILIHFTLPNFVIIWHVRESPAILVYLPHVHTESASRLNCNKPHLSPTNFLSHK